MDELNNSIPEDLFLLVNGSFLGLAQLGLGMQELSYS